VFDHVTIRVGDLEASRRFYDRVFEALSFEVEPFTSDALCEWHDFSIAPSDAEHPATQRLHVGFAARSRDRVDAFWESLTAAGYSDDGVPGPRPQYRPEYYGAFVLDPDGNSAEAVHHDIVRTDEGTIDHLWLRTRDVQAVKRFYDAIAPVVGIALRKDRNRIGDRINPVPDALSRAGFRGEHGSFSFVSGEQPTEHVHLAFAVADNAAVDEFHRVALAAGYRDNGAPGERQEYHAGYYGAYVLDPDGHNVEAVCHNR
jgi:catechol 2,3-dioxygenase-like lactoylglutathione lyase family enzyme